MDVSAAGFPRDDLPPVRDEPPEVAIPVAVGVFTVVDGFRAVSEPTVSSIVTGVNGPGASALRPSSSKEGSKVHEATAIDLCGGRVDPHWEEYTRQARLFLERSQASAVAVEVPVFTVGSYGGFLDCLAVRSNGLLMAIDWKTGRVTAADAVKLAAYTCAERRLVTEETTVAGPGPEGDEIYWGRSYPAGRSQISRAWIVQLAPGRCRAFGFAPNDDPEPPQYHALRRLLDPSDDAKVSLPRWWRWEWEPNSGLTHQPTLV